MKTHELFEQTIGKRDSNTSVKGVLSIIARIYLGQRAGTSTRLCHAHTAQNLKAAAPDDKIVLFGYGDMVVHSAIVSKAGELIDQYEGVSSSKLLPTGNLQVQVKTGVFDELEPVYSILVSEFLSAINPE